jgi:predicted transcriptional regulator
MASTLSAKQASLKLIEQLDDDVTYEEILYELNLLQKIERGLRDVQEGRVTPHDQVKRKYEKWLS